MTPDAKRLFERSQARTRRVAHWLRSEEVSPERGDFLHFLGTGGNPSGVIGQRRRTGGLWLNLDGCAVAIDPGPGAAYHAARAHLDSRRLSAVLISHGHTDHYLAAGALIEGMCRGMSRRQGILALPGEALRGGLVGRFHRGEEPSPWYQGGPDIATWREGVALPIGPLSVTPFRVEHGPENYGLVVRGGGMTIAYSSDASYVRSYRDASGALREVRGGEALALPSAVVAVREELVQAMRGADLAVLNISFFWQHAHRHLTAIGAADLLRRSGVKRAVITHFDQSAGPDADEIAAFVASESGAEVLAARDGMRLQFSHS